MSEMTNTRAADVRTAAAVWGALRAGVGITALLAPKALARPWVGRTRPDHAGTVLGRALGGRDLALAAGMIAAARSGESMLPWIIAGGGADLVDTGATLASWRELPRSGRWLVLAAAGGSVAIATGLAALTAGRDESREA